jgi:DNA-binding MarR family transcriptional regulator
VTDPLPCIDPFSDGRSPAKDPAGMDEASSLIDAAFRFDRAVSRIGNTRLRPWNITLTGYMALRILANKPHLSLAQLARRCYVRPQGLTRIVSALAERGWVSRGTNPESERALSLQVTESGLAALEEMDAQVLKISATLNATLGLDTIVSTDRQLRQAALVVEGELREMERARRLGARPTGSCFSVRRRRR